MRKRQDDRVFSDPAFCVCLGLRKTARLLTQFYDEKLRDSGISVAQYGLLAYASRAEGSAIAEIADGLALDQTTVTRNVQYLVREGLLAIRVDPKDRRRRVVHLTRSGEKALAAAHERWLEAQAETLERIGATQWKSTFKRLERLSP